MKYIQLNSLKDASVLLSFIRNYKKTWFGEVKEVAHIKYICGESIMFLYTNLNITLTWIPNKFKSN